MELRTALPTALVVAAATALWLATGVEPDEALRYVAYELAFVLAPGVLVLSALSPGSRSWLWRVCLGWPLGLVLEVAAFSLTAALDARGLFLAYPLLVGGAAAVVWWRRRAAGAPAAGEPDDAAKQPFGAPQRWVLAGLCLISFGYLGLTMIALFPLPGTVPEVFYGPDTMFSISVVAEAMNHWPVTTPQVSGVPLEYHYLSHLHVAAISQVTDVSPVVVYTRLWWVPLLALAVLQVALSGRAIARFAWAGPLAATLFLLVHAFDLTVPNNGPFLDYHGLWLTDSPSYTFGLVLFVPLVLLMAGLLERGLWERFELDSRKAGWAVAGLLMLGSAGAKPVGVPLVIGGLGMLCLYSWLRSRSLDRTALAGLAAGVATMVLFLFALYGAPEAGGFFTLSFGGAYDLMQGLNAVRPAFPDEGPLRAGLTALGAAGGTVLLLAPSLVGLIWVVKRGAPPPGDGSRFLLFVLATGLLATFFLHDQSAAEVYFAQYGIIAATPLAALGLHRALRPWLRGPAADRRRVLLGVTAWTALCLALAYVGWQLYQDGHEGRSYLIYVPLALAFAGFLAVVWRSPPSRRPAAVAFVVLAVIVPASLDLALDSVPETLRKAAEDEPLYVETFGFTPDDNRAANWMRENLDEDAVLTISNQRSPEAAVIQASHTEFPAVAERRGFYEGWVYSIESVRVGRDDVLYGRKFPYPERRRLETLLFEQADPGALREMVGRYGVTHVVVDRDDGYVDPRLYRYGEVVFANPGIQVIELSPQRVVAATGGRGAQRTR